MRLRVFTIEVIRNIIQLTTEASNLRVCVIVLWRIQILLTYCMNRSTKILPACMSLSASSYSHSGSCGHCYILLEQLKCLAGWYLSAAVFSTRSRTLTGTKQREHISLILPQLEYYPSVIQQWQQLSFRFDINDDEYTSFLLVVEEKIMVLKHRLGPAYKATMYASQKSSYNGYTSPTYRSGN